MVWTENQLITTFQIGLENNCLIISTFNECQKKKFFDFRKKSYQISLQCLMLYGQFIGLIDNSNECIAFENS